MRPWTFACLLAICLAGLIASVVIHETTSLDQWVQDYLYNAQQGTWFIDKDAPGPRFVFYNLPKFVAIGLGATLVISLILDRFQGKADTLASRRRFFLLMCLILIPLTIAIWKRYSGVFCPSELTWYGGKHTFRLLFQARPNGAEVGHCFPGAHASAGFALVGFSLLPQNSMRRWTALLAALLIGWVMGAYQMAKGAHFLTHTLATMFTALIIALLLGAWLLRTVDSMPESDASVKRRAGA